MNHMRRESVRRTAVFVLGLLLSSTALAQTARCRFLEQVILMQYGLAEGQPCHGLYQACLSHPFRKDDPIPKTRCLETVYCGTKFWAPAMHGVSNDSNLEVFKQECEPE